MSRLTDPNNGTFLAWGLMAAEAALILWWAYYYEVVSLTKYETPQGSVFSV
jgi:hypothetical protein